jgi:hypothetical protein
LNPEGNLNFSEKEKMWFARNNIFIEFVKENSEAMELINKWDGYSRAFYLKLKTDEEKKAYLEKLNLDECHDVIFGI